MKTAPLIDLLIVGAGPIGLACGIEASKRNLSHLILDKGCLVNSIFHYPQDMTFFSTSEKIEIGGLPFVSHDARPSRREALEYYRRVADTWELNLNLYERVDHIRKNSDSFQIESDKGSYRARAVIIATGFFDNPNYMRIPGEDLPKVRHYFDDPHPYIGQKVVVVGAANSAVDAALSCWRKGAEVTMVIREPEINHRVKYWVRPDIDNRIKEGSITAFFNTSITEILPEEVRITGPEGPRSLANDWVLAMTGFHPDYSWLAGAGVQFEDDEWRTPIRDERTFESNVPMLYLAGTVCGGMNTNKWFIENSIVHANTVLDQISHRLKTRS